MKKSICLFRNHSTTPSIQEKQRFKIKEFKLKGHFKLTTTEDFHTQKSQKSTFHPQMFTKTRTSNLTRKTTSMQSTQRGLKIRFLPYSFIKRATTSIPGYIKNSFLPFKFERKPTASTPRYNKSTFMPYSFKKRANSTTRSPLLSKSTKKQIKTLPTTTSKVFESKYLHEKFEAKVFKIERPQKDSISKQLDYTTRKTAITEGDK